MLVGKDIVSKLFLYADVVVVVVVGIIIKLVIVTVRV